MASDTRSTILYVVIDRPEDIDLAWHDPNVAGVRAAAATFDPSTHVEVVTIGDLDGMDAASIDARWSPLAIFNAGSWSEWFQYGLDADWKRRLDGYMAFLRSTKVPIHAVCGSHQLVAAAFNGWSAVAHMNDVAPPISIATELAANPPTLLAPDPRVGEQGTYPITPTDAGSADPLVASVMAQLSAPMASLHHCDEVVDTTGFVLLWSPDRSRAPATTATGQSLARCDVQGMVLADPTRLLYSTQFHPEISGFAESVGDDGGFGRAWLVAFFGLARAHWATTAATVA